MFVGTLIFCHNDFTTSQNIDPSSGITLYIFGH